MSATPYQKRTGYGTDKIYDPRNKKDSPGYFAIISGGDGFPIWVLPGSQRYLKYPLNRRKKLRDNLLMEILIASSNSFFIGHGHLTHAGAGWEDRIVNRSTVQYHLYMRPDKVIIRDNVFYGLQGAVKFEELSVAEEVGHV